MTEHLLANLKNIRNVEIKSKVVLVKNHPPKVMTAVRFEFEGEPSEIQSMLLAEAQNQPINATFNCPQLSFEIDKERDLVGSKT
jgi:hypothetical protein